MPTLEDRASLNAVKGNELEAFKRARNTKIKIWQSREKYQRNAGDARPSAGGEAPRLDTFETEKRIGR
jgi:hypothetical protein